MPERADSLLSVCRKTLSFRMGKNCTYGNFPLELLLLAISACGVFVFLQRIAIRQACSFVKCLITTIFLDFRKLDMQLQYYFYTFTTLRSRKDITLKKIKIDSLGLRHSHRFNLLTITCTLRVAIGTTPYATALTVSVFLWGWGEENERSTQ